MNGAKDLKRQVARISLLGKSRKSMFTRLENSLGYPTGAPIDAPEGMEGVERQRRLNFELAQFNSMEEGKANMAGHGEYSLAHAWQDAPEDLQNAPLFCMEDGTTPMVGKALQKKLSETVGNLLKKYNSAKEASLKTGGGTASGDDEEEEEEEEEEEGGEKGEEGEEDKVTGGDRRYVWREKADHDGPGKALDETCDMKVDGDERYETAVLLNELTHSLFASRASRDAKGMDTEDSDEGEEEEEEGEDEEEEEDSKGEGGGGAKRPRSESLGTKSTVSD
jgi:hypothetical protein